MQDKAFEVKMSGDINFSHLKGLLQFKKDYDFSLNIICLESKKRIVTIDKIEIKIWPVQDFLDELWSNEIWK